MSRLYAIRQQQNLTQEELYERSGISVRTIQRIEAGTSDPKGYTLKALAKGLGIPEDELREKEGVTVTEHNATLLKWINISSLPFIIFPPLNIAAPLLVMLFKKQFGPIAKKIVTIQIVWTLVAGVLILMIILLNDVFGIRGQYMKLVPVIWLLANVFIILLNAAAIAGNRALRIDIKFSLF
ncbi:helix-turn-helix domain-containing protein [Mucilaginibacter panaciglaebae]|uniref:HTH cro/C1-type domain-containing protein n=1 Tax=Mucilaginibacter panaciglaebae TaxID=502331 RepID=A0ABP7WE31_9SPHI